MVVRRMPATMRRHALDPNLPEWVLAPQALDYLSAGELLSDELAGGLWRYRSWQRHLDRVEDWCEERGFEFPGPCPLNWPQLPGGWTIDP
jgi:hypothetical protein